jgi:hypothetical protein
MPAERAISPEHPPRRDADGMRIDQFDSHDREASATKRKTLAKSVPAKARDEAGIPLFDGRTRRTGCRFLRFRFVTL